MNEVTYIWEKVLVAVGCLCGGAGAFEKRLDDAYISALVRLGPHGFPAELAEDLNWVLSVCNRHIVPGDGGMSPVPESDRLKLAEKLVHLLIEISRMTAGKHKPAAKAKRTGKGKPRSK